MLSYNAGILTSLSNRISDVALLVHSYCCRQAELKTTVNCEALGLNESSANDLISRNAVAVMHSGQYV